MTTFADAGEIHQEALVTVKLYVPGIRPVTVHVIPVPEMAPGFSVQFPDGKPLRTTLPVDTVQVGWVMVPTVGAVGVAGWGLIKMLADACEVHPAELVTVNVYVPATSPDIV